jgi:hypothetical protein
MRRVEGPRAAPPPAAREARRRAARSAIVPLAAVVALGAALPPPAPAEGWRTLEPGLDLGVFRSPMEAAAGDSRVRVLRVDPARFALRLLNASAPGEGRNRTAREWARRHGLVAAINASMYQTDLRTSVSLMRTAGHVNNPRVSRDRTVLAFDPLDRSQPRVQIIDRECQDFETLRGLYATLVQSIRMVACDGRNVWAPQRRAFSTAAIGTDRRGRILLLHARSPWTTHDFIDILLALPIELKSAMYAEGGREAQLYVAAGGEEHEFVGIPEGRVGGEEPVAGAHPLPNVIGVARSRDPVR